MIKIIFQQKYQTWFILFIMTLITFFSVASIYLQFEAFKVLFNEENRLKNFIFYQILSLIFEFIYRMFYPLVNIFIEKQATKIIVFKKIEIIKIIGEYNPKKFNSIGHSEYIYDLEKNANLYFFNYVKNFYSIYFSLLSFLLITIFITIQAIFYSSWVLLTLLLILVSLIFSFLIPMIFTKRNKNNNQAKIDIKNKNLSAIANTLEGYKYFYVHNKVDNFKNKLKEYFYEVEKINFMFQKKRILYNFLENSLESLADRLLYIITIFLTLINPVNKFLALLLQPMTDNLKSNSSSAIEEIKELKVSEPLKNNFEKYKINATNEKLQKIAQIDKINIQNFNLAFNEKDKNLFFKSVNLLFEKNKKYLIYGNSGIGKSTVIKSIIKEQNYTEGFIKINNLLVESIDLQSIYNDLIVIDNKIVDFEGTIKEVITFYEKNISESKLKYVIEKAFINFDIERKYNDLSHGEKQRVKLAWCFYYDKKVIILDEALSNIDSKTSTKIERNLLDKNDILLIHISHNHNLENADFYNEEINFNELVK
ncbi:ATP-binding cassette domain-containing protein [Candidatus Mycoplasma pogonae]